MDLLDTLYSVSIIVVLLGYAPQIHKLWRSDSDTSDISLPAWITWLLTSLAGLAYAWLKLHDFKYSLLCLGNTTAIAAIIALYWRNTWLRPRLRRRRNSRPE